MSETPPPERAKALALRVLAFHARTEAQLRARLAKAGLAEAADDTIAWLSRLGYLDDAAYAGAHARALLAPGRFGPRAAERRLRDAGITAPAARAAVAAALETHATGAAEGRAQEAALCRAALARKLRGVSFAAQDARGRARLARFLLGRGFSGEAVQRVLDLDDEVA
jgi:regulatory protein